MDLAGSENGIGKDQDVIDEVLRSVEMDPDAGIKYRVEYRDLISSKVVHEYETQGLGVDLEQSGPEIDTIFELVTTFVTSKYAETFSPRGLPAPSVSMHIKSRAIINALQSVVRYYPGQNLSGDTIIIPAPYALLVHYEQELDRYRRRFAPGTSEKVCVREKGTYEHLGVLQSFLEQHIMPAVEEERARILNGRFTWDMLWLHYKPGTTHTMRVAGRMQETYGRVVHSLSLSQNTWSVKYWCLVFDGTFLKRVPHEVLHFRFSGEDTATWETVDIGHRPRTKWSHELVERGRKYWNLLRKQCKHYSGRTIDFPNNRIDGLVMTDSTAYFAGSPMRKPTVGKELEGDSRNWITDCMCAVCKSRHGVETEKNDTMFGNYDWIGLYDQDDLTDHQYFLCPSHVWSFVFRTRTWEKLHVDFFQEPAFEESMIDKLVMSPERVNTLKALAKSFIRINKHGDESKREAWTADFVKGKGHGLTFLLHGKPGVGKTCTAECIAGFTKRPLMVLTSSDIGTDPKTVEDNLTKHFKTAKSWGAVLLIDEADVFMERRSTADLTRNSLVAGFLRALEFYEGILFLTTNRVGSFDDAFVSRIHVQLYYPDFNESDRRKIWQTFIDKLEQERGDYMRLNIDAKEYLDGNELKAVKWNGREIRNAFQTAVSLAEYDAIPDKENKILVTDKHLKAVVEMSRDFKNYLEELHGANESRRAELHMERLDDYQPRRGE